MENVTKRLSPMMRMKLHDFLRKQIWDLEHDLAEWEHVSDDNGAKQEMLGWLKAAKEMEQALGEK